MIVDAFAASGAPVTEFIVAGGLNRNRFLMQVYADVLRRPVSLATSDQAPGRSRRGRGRSSALPVFGAAGLRRAGGGEAHAPGTSNHKR